MKVIKIHFFQDARRTSAESRLGNLPLSSLPKMFQGFFADKWTSAMHLARCQTKWISCISFQHGWCALQTQYPCASLLVEICFTQLVFSLFFSIYITYHHMFAFHTSPAALLFTISNFFCRSATYQTRALLLSVRPAPAKQLSQLSEEPASPASFSHCPAPWSHFLHSFHLTGLSPGYHEHL